MPMMKCGHAANAERVTKEGKKEPVCVICFGIDPGASIIDENPPDFEGRTAICSDCKGNEVPSNIDLAFFESTPEKEHDRYYCGCRGWD